MFLPLLPLSPPSRLADSMPLPVRPSSALPTTNLLDTAHSTFNAPLPNCSPLPYARPHDILQTYCKRSLASLPNASEHFNVVFIFFFFFFHAVFFFFPFSSSSFICCCLLSVSWSPFSCLLCLLLLLSLFFFALFVVIYCYVFFFCFFFILSFLFVY